MMELYLVAGAVIAVVGGAWFYLRSRDKKVRQEAYDYVERESAKQAKKMKARMDAKTSKRLTAKETKDRLKNGTF